MVGATGLQVGFEFVLGDELSTDGFRFVPLHLGQVHDEVVPLGQADEVQEVQDNETIGKSGAPLVLGEERVDVLGAEFPQLELMLLQEVEEVAEHPSVVLYGSLGVMLM